MAIGDANDFAARFLAVLPGRWFPSSAPVLSSVAAAIGAVWTQVYALYAWTVLQTRIATSTGAMVDLAAMDFYGTALTRRAGEADPSLRMRIKVNMFRQRGTRYAVVRVLTDLGAVAPIVFEPARPADTGGYARGGVGYGAGGGYGSQVCPMQFFVTAYRGSISPIANIMGYGNTAVIGNWAGGGYTVGAIEYISLSQTQGLVTDATIYAAIASVLPVCAIAWVKILNHP